MSFPLVFHPAVQGEIDDSYQWYEQQPSGLGKDFPQALDEVLNRLQQTPEMHQIIYGQVRRALTPRFPHAVYYRVHDDRVEVIAVQHTRRNPAHWQSRA